MPSYSYPQLLNEVLLAFVLWMSAFVCLTAAVLLVVLSVSLVKLMKGPATARRFLP